MNLTVQRRILTPQATEGELFLDGVFDCYTLEPKDRKYAVTAIDGGPVKPYAIPAGSYPWMKYLSPKMGFEVVLVTEVPGFTSIEIHPGNFPKDTLGCTVVGTFEQQNFVGHSQEAFRALMAKLPDLGTIDYLDAPAEAPSEEAENPPQASVG